jgi:hypothetical protein
MSSEGKRRLRQKGRGGMDPRHVRLYHTMLRTEAWRSLNATQRAIYIDISARYGGPGSNNGRIPYSVRDARKSLFGIATAAAALRVLQERGFVVATTLGGFICKIRRATEWRLTEYPSDVGSALATREYERWSTKIQNTVSEAEPTVSEAEQVGICKRTVAA